MNVNRWVIIFTIGTFCFLIAICGLGIVIINPPGQVLDSSHYQITMLAAPVMTPQVDYLVYKTPTPEFSNEAIDTKGITINTVVQIFNTDGAGLRLREGPGIMLPVKFIALDSELYEVSAGPEEADGYIWWYLMSPYDENRSGWAASNYLTIIEQNQ